MEENGVWLDFVVANRKRMPMPEQSDIVIGPVANDSTIDVINDYMRGRFAKLLTGRSIIFYTCILLLKYNSTKCRINKKPVYRLHWWFRV